jgi:hypothetical protein
MSLLAGVSLEEARGDLAGRKGGIALDERRLPGLVDVAARTHADARIVQPPTQLLRRRVPPPHGAPWSPGDADLPAGPASPNQEACTGGSRLWFPILRSAFLKMVI